MSYVRARRMSTVPKQLININQYDEHAICKGALAGHITCSFRNIQFPSACNIWSSLISISPVFINTPKAVTSYTLVMFSFTNTVAAFCKLSQL